jgi:hypothetical protein
LPCLAEGRHALGLKIQPVTQSSQKRTGHFSTEANAHRLMARISYVEGIAALHLLMTKSTGIPLLKDI